MDIDARLKLLRRLVRSKTEAATVALTKEMTDVSDTLATQTEYEALEQGLDILNVIGERFSQQSIDILDKFTQSVESRSLKYSHTTVGFADYIANYRNAQSLIVKAIEVLVRLRYLETKSALRVLLRISDHADEKIRKKALSGLESFARYDLDVFYGVDRKGGVGPCPQLQILEVLESLDNSALDAHRAPVLRMLMELLSPTMEGTRWSSDAMTLSRGATPGIASVADVRRRSIELLRRLYGLTTTKREKLSIINVLNAATRADSHGVSDEKTAAMWTRDTLEILEFYGELIPKEDLQIVQKLESNSYWIFVHAINEEVKSAAKNIEKALVERKEYSIYRTLIGFEGVFGDWSTLARSGDYIKSKEKERRETAARFADSITEENYPEWRDRILLYAKTESEDLATFPVFYFFLGKFAKARPELALRLITEEIHGVAFFLIPILSNLWDGPQREATRTLIEKWIQEATTGVTNYLFGCVKMFLSTQHVDVNLLKRILQKADAINEIPTIRQIATVAIARYKDADDALVNELFLPAIDLLTQRNDASWIFEVWYRQEAIELFDKLGPEIDDRILRNLIILPKIDFEAEEVLSRIAQKAPESVVDFFCKRIAIDSERHQDREREFEAIPFSFDKLCEPLSRIASLVVRRVYKLYNEDDLLFEFRGARLLRNIFPNFSDAFEAELLQLLRSGEEKAIRFVVCVLRAYQGQLFIRRLCREILKVVPEGSAIVDEVETALLSTGVVSGFFGMAEAYELKRQEVLEWLADPNERVRAFAKRYISVLESMRETEKKRAEEEIALRKHRYSED